jgi:hypothetical protein
VQRIESRIFKGEKLLRRAVLVRLGAISIVGVGWGKYANVGGEKSLVLMRCFGVLGRGGGLTRGIWAVFEVVLGNLFCGRELGGGGRADFARYPLMTMRPS